MVWAPLFPFYIEIVRKLGQRGYGFAQDRGSVWHPTQGVHAVQWCDTDLQGCCPDDPRPHTACMKPDALAVGLHLWAPTSVLTCMFPEKSVDSRRRGRGGRYCALVLQHSSKQDSWAWTCSARLAASARPAWAPPPHKAAAQESVAEQSSQAGEGGFVFTFYWRRTSYRHQWHFTSRTHVPSRPRLLSGSLLALPPPHRGDHYPAVRA